MKKMMFCFFGTVVVLAFVVGAILLTDGNSDQIFVENVEVLAQNTPTVPYPDDEPGNFPACMSNHGYKDDTTAKVCIGGDCLLVKTKQGTLDVNSCK